MLLDELIELTAGRLPDATALTGEGRTESFRELCTSIARLRDALAQEVPPGERVAILARNIPEYVHALYAAPAAGTVLVLLNYRLHWREWATILQETETRVLLVHSELFDAAGPALADLPSLQRVAVIDGAPDSETFGAAVDYGTWIAEPRASQPRQRRDDDPAWLIFTSGTTGQPKGALLSHRNIVTAALQSHLALNTDDDDRFLMSWPLCHASAFQIVQFHLAGTPVILLRAFEATAFLDAIEKHRVTVTGLAPTMARFVLDHPDLQRRDTSSIRLLTYGGMPMPAEIARQLSEQFGQVLYTCYGQTETTGSLTALTPDDHARALDDERLLASCGRVLPLAAIRIVDSDGQPCPPDTPGELLVRGDQVMLGYWRAPEATAETIVEGWLHTGDVATIDAEGYLYLVDRLKGLVITGGQNVYPRQVEAVLEQHPAVAEVAVFGLPDEQWGEQVTAAVRLHPGSKADSHELETTCRQHLAGYKVPRQFVFVTEPLPVNTTGKVSKRLLRARYVTGDGGK